MIHFSFTQEISGLMKFAAFEVEKHGHAVGSYF